MADKDGVFEPRLGRAGSRKGDHGFHTRVVMAARRSGITPRRRARLFQGVRLGRGGSLGMILRSKRADPTSTRAVHARLRVVRLDRKGLAATYAHLRYLQHERGDKELRGEFYSAEEANTPANSFFDRLRSDRHCFKILISAEDADQYPDLKPITHRLMRQMGVDLGSDLEWIAIDHFDNGRPHTHIVLRGKADDKRDLIISPGYIYGGLEARAKAIVNLDLGTRTGYDIEARSRADMQRERFQPIDRELMAETQRGGITALPSDDMALGALKLIRLKTLEQLGLASEVGFSRWQLRSDFAETLRAIEDRHRVHTDVYRALERQGIKRAAADIVVHRTAPRKQITGEIKAMGLDEATGLGRFAIIDAVDGLTHCVSIGKSVAAAHALAPGQIVKSPAVDSSGPDGTSASPQQFAILSNHRLSALMTYDGPTWLDHKMTAFQTLDLRDKGFGRELRQALAQRMQWLVEQGLAGERDGEMAVNSNALELLERRERRGLTSALSAELGSRYQHPAPHQDIDGVVTRRISLPTRVLALVETKGGFALLPWGSDLDGRLGVAARISMGPRGPLWSFGKSAPARDMDI